MLMTLFTMHIYVHVVVKYVAYVIYNSKALVISAGQNPFLPVKYYSVSTEP